MRNAQEHWWEQPTLLERSLTSPDGPTRSASPLFGEAGREASPPPCLDSFGILPCYVKLERVDEKIDPAAKLLKNLERQLNEMDAIPINSNDFICKICFERQVNIRLTCGHLFCEECVMSIQNNKCALCNTIFQTEVLEHGRVYFC